MSEIVVPLKINLLDAHDRLKHFKGQSQDIGECCQDIINQAPFGNRSFYIFAHGRTTEDGSGTRVIWQPRLTKPKAETNSMLFKAHPGTDVILVMWVIPKREQWKNYAKGKLCENETIWNDIQDFLYNRKRLESPDLDDPNDAEIDAIYQELSREAKRNKLMAKLYTRV